MTGKTSNDSLTRLAHEAARMRRYRAEHPEYKRRTPAEELARYRLAHPLTERACLVCGAAFLPAKSNSQKICDACPHRSNRPDTVGHPCGICGAWLFGREKYCPAECRAEARRRKNRRDEKRKKERLLTDPKYRKKERDRANAKNKKRYHSDEKYRRKQIEQSSARSAKAWGALRAIRDLGIEV